MTVAETRTARRPRPLLVTGVPRSGTTWLARFLTQAPGTAMAGREPMNPKSHQFKLAGTLDGWGRITDPTPKQRRALVLTYKGLHPLGYSRYGVRRWAAPLPTSRLIVKDPFALISLPAIVRTTGALPVLVYRHPGAVPASYRRMGWGPDLEELQAIVEHARATGGPDVADLPRRGETSPVEEMGRFWAALHDLALGDLAATSTEAIVLSHQEVATSGPDAGRRLAERLGLTWNDAMEAELAKESSSEGKATKLHNFDRAPSEVAESWRRKLEPAEVETIERVTEGTRQRLEATRLVLRTA